MRWHAATYSSQQLADAIAAEAHDTLAHSLSLMALNASALKADGDSRLLADKAEDGAAGALDEAHSIIDMLRNTSSPRPTTRR